MDDRYRAALHKLEAGDPVPWSSSGSYIEDLKRQLNPSHHTTFERAMQFRTREKRHLATVSEERDDLQQQLRDARLEHSKMQYRMALQNSNYQMRLNVERARTRNARSRGSSSLRGEPTAEGVGSSEARNPPEQQPDDGPAQRERLESPGEPPDLGGHASEHGSEELADRSEPGASVPPTEGPVREGGE